MMYKITVRPAPLSRERLKSLAAWQRATERARATLVPGDRLHVRRCGGGNAVVTFTGFDLFSPNWICCASRNDISAQSIYKVNGEEVSFADPPGFKPPLFAIERLRLARWWERLRFDWTLWRSTNTPQFRLHRQTTSTDAYDGEGYSLTIRWRSYAVELHAIRLSSDDEIPF